MILGYNSNGLAHHRLDEAIDLLASRGYEALALTLDHCHLDPERATREEILGIRAQLQGHGMRCVIETGARFILDPRRKHRPNLLEASASARQRRLDFLLRCMDIGAELGAEACSLWSGTLPSGVSPQAGRDYLLGMLDLLCQRSRELCLPLAFEPEPGMLIETVEQAIEIRAALGNPPEFGLTVDIGHLYVTGEGSPSVIFPRLASLDMAHRIRQVHVEDIRRGIHAHLPPGEGDVDFPDLWAVLDEIGYQGPVCWELSRSSHNAIEMLDRAKACFLAR